MPTIEAPYFPVVYVRGFAGNDSEIDAAVADPYMGFNLGATKFRQTWTGAVRRHYFESPLVRLAKDFGYTDVYSAGAHMPAGLQISPKSVVVYRYYDEQFFDDLTAASTDLDSVEGRRRDVEHFAEGLGLLILRLRDRICGDDHAARATFRVNLVAHSMGGLVCRCFLQNDAVGTTEAKSLVDKVFTYATPHNGIDFRVIGNVPGFFSANNANNFNRARMREYLALPESSPVDNLNGRFDPTRFFCLVGSNWRDYAATAGWSQRLTGPMSDGLVRISNAAVHSDNGDGTTTNAPRAFVHRSHSGEYGIVNSEEGYQNLARFLFGDVRVDGVLEVEALSLPSEIQKAKDDRKKIRASYHFETVVKVRGYDWDLHSRTVAEESAVFRTFDEMFPDDGSPRNPYLFSAYLSTAAKVKRRRPSLGFAVELGVLVPDYEVDGFLMFDRHYKGSRLYRDTLTIEATPVADPGGTQRYSIRYGYESRSPNRATRTAELTPTGDAFVCRIPIDSKSVPGITGMLALYCSEWNRD